MSDASGSSGTASATGKPKATFRPTIPGRPLTGVTGVKPKTKAPAKTTKRPAPSTQSQSSQSSQSSQPTSTPSQSSSQSQSSSSSTQPLSTLSQSSSSSSQSSQIPTLPLRTPSQPGIYDDNGELLGLEEGSIATAADQALKQIMQAPSSSTETALTLSASSSSSSSSTDLTADQQQQQQPTETEGENSVMQIDANKHPSGIIPAIQNVVATCLIAAKVDLKAVAMRARNAEYNPKRFPAVVMRIRQPKSTALVFASGKMVCTGARNEADARLACRKYARIIQKLDVQEITFSDFKIQNIVASCDLRFPVRLEGLAAEHEDFTSYEPELFPGLIYRMVSPKLVILVFVSGKVVITGAKTRDHVYEAFENLYPTLVEFKKTRGTLA